MELSDRLKAVFRQFFRPPPEPSRATLNLLTRLLGRGGYVDDADPFAEQWFDELIDACRRGLVNAGSGLDAGWWITPKGKRLASEHQRRSAPE